MYRDVENRVHEIAGCIFHAMKNQELEIADLGLLSGQTGIIIFCSHYLKEYPDSKKAEILDSYMNIYFDRLTSGVEMFTYCSGLAGILDGLRYMNETKLIDVDFSDIENNYVAFLQKFALQSIADINYDYLHGALGVIKYFHDDSVFVNEALVLLEQMAEKEGDSYKWKSRTGMERTVGYNIALSHGISSIVAVLSQLNSSSINLEVRNRIITNACNYILSQEIAPLTYGCYFPSMSLENSSETILRSRMAWCYGDLGVAVALWQAGKTMNNEFWKSKALEVYTYSSQRRSPKDSMILDAELCHGTASLAMMFEYMNQQTGNDLYRETRDFWIQQTLGMKRFDDGLAGYKIWQGFDKEWAKEYVLLDGISGIGLMLMSVLPQWSGGKEWMKFFMLQ